MNGRPTRQSTTPSGRVTIGISVAFSVRVYLKAVPQSEIDRLAVDARADGQINVNAYLSGVASNCIVVASVTDTNNFQLGSPFTNTVSAGASNVLLSATLPSPQLWSAEFPNLYTLTVQLLQHE